MGKASGGGNGDGGAEEDLGDDDIVMEGGQQELLNNKCPRTQKNVSAWDVQGFKSALLNMLNAL